MKFIAIGVAALALAIPLSASAKTKPRGAGAGVCPSVSILTDATRLTQMQNGRIDLKAEIRTPALSCSLTGDKAKSHLSFSVKSAIAPTSAATTRTVPYFVAIISEGKVIGKEVFQLALPFVGDKRKLMVKEYVDRIEIPIAPNKSADDYAVTIGFQLTQEQVEYNRTASR